MSDLIIIFIISAAAFLSPLIADKIRIPAVILEIVFGMLLAFFYDVSNLSWLEFFAFLGLIFLMFLSGLEIDFSTIEKRKNFVVDSLLYILLSFAAACVFVLSLGIHIIYAIFLTNVSLGLVVPVLREKRLTGTDFGQSVLVTTFLTDFTTMMLLSMLVIYEKSESISLELFLSLGIILLFVLFYFIGERLIWRFPNFFKRLYEDPMEVGVRGAFALMIAFSGVATLLGSEVILGAFLAGALISAVLRGSGSLGGKLEAIGYGIFIPIFFLKTGAELYGSLSVVNVLFVLYLTISAFAVKVLPSFVFFKKFGIKDSLRMGIIQVSKLSLTVAGAEIAGSAGILTSSEVANVVFFTLIVGLIAPTIFKIITKYPLSG